MKRLHLRAKIIMKLTLNHFHTKERDLCKRCCKVTMAISKNLGSFRSFPLAGSGDRFGERVAGCVGVVVAGVVVRLIAM